MWEVYLKKKIRSNLFFFMNSQIWKLANFFKTEIFERHKTIGERQSEREGLIDLKNDFELMNTLYNVVLS